MVGHMTLNHVILVRAQVWQPMYFVYLLLCADDSIYTGITTDVKRRFGEHKMGKGGAYTRSRGVNKIVYTERHATRSKALKREAQIKRWKRDKKIALCKM